MYCRRSRSRIKINNTLSLCTVKLGAHIAQRSASCPLIADMRRLAFVAELYSLMCKVLQLTYRKQLLHRKQGKKYFYLVCR